MFILNYMYYCVSLPVNYFVHVKTGIPNKFTPTDYIFATTLMGLLIDIVFITPIYNYLLFNMFKAKGHNTFWPENELMMLLIIITTILAGQYIRRTDTTQVIERFKNTRVSFKGIDSLIGLGLIVGPFIIFIYNSELRHFLFNQ